MEQDRTYTVFSGDRRVGSGALSDVLAILKTRFDAGDTDALLVFEDETGQQVDFDLRGTLTEVLERAAPQPARGPGRPRLGVVSREVSLLPRHWEWLEEQPNGISSALRRLVDQARKSAPGAERGRRLRTAVSRFMTAMAGNLPRFEEASRALFAKEQARFERLVRAWPKDVREHVVRLTREATREESAESSAPAD